MTIDRESRSIARTDYTRSIALEAAAGTGNTEALADRVAYLSALKRGPDGKPR